MCERNLEQLKVLAKEIKSESGVVIKDRCYLFKTYLTCFIGYELVDWLVKSGHAKTREEAVKLGESLLSANLIHHVVDRHHFKDQYLFYRFLEDDVASDPSVGPSVASLKAECGTKYSWAKSPGLVFWGKYYFMLKTGDTTLYEFKTDLDLSPSHTYDLKNATVAIDKAASYCIALKFADIQIGVLKLAFESDTDQLAWLKQFEKCGVATGQTEEAVEETIKNAKSIYEFEAKDIDGNMVSLSKYKGFVTLIVNVASF